MMIEILSNGDSEHSWHVPQKFTKMASCLCWCNDAWANASSLQNQMEYFAPELKRFLSPIWFQDL